jgi:UDP-N-acetylmuramoylalanine-D-glutamate ligase
LDWHNGFDNYQKAKFNIIYGSEHNLIRYEILNKNELAPDDFKEYNAKIFGRKGEYMYV